MSGVGSYSVKGTTSFSTIHKEVSDVALVVNTYESVPDSRMYGPRRSRGEKPGGEATGEVPMGDMLVPMLVAVVAYAMRKFFCNRKQSQVL